jgi:hypothetical protein
MEIVNLSALAEASPEASKGLSYVVALENERRATGKPAQEPISEQEYADARTVETAMSYWRAYLDSQAIDLAPEFEISKKLSPASQQAVKDFIHARGQEENIEGAKPQG